MGLIASKMHLNSNTAVIGSVIRDSVADTDNSLQRQSPQVTKVALEAMVFEADNQRPTNHSCMSTMTVQIVHKLCRDNREFDHIAT